jgi:thiamine biosynthesis lipoprotein
VTVPAKTAAAALAVTFLSTPTTNSVDPQLVSREVFLMGTRATLAIYAPTRARGLATLETALGVLEQTEAELSTWRDPSDISLLNRQPIGAPWQADQRACRMFADVWKWHSATEGTFDPGIGRLLDAWDVHGMGVLPNQLTQTRARALSGLALFVFDPERCTVTRRADARIDVGAFGKGEALDRVEAALVDDAPWMIDLGGQVSVGGRPLADGWEVAIADPSQRDRALLQVRLTAGSLSTSGGSQRSLVVNGQRVGHIFDPRTGMPAPFSGAVTVWHPSGLAADALSTALFVMGPEEGLSWADTHGIAAFYAIPDGNGVTVKAAAAFRNASGLRISERE